VADPSLQSGKVFRFGVFEFDSGSGELRRSGVKIRTADQAIKVLHVLLVRQGEVVTRQELSAVLWPDGTNVDFENGLNAAVKSSESLWATQEQLRATSRRCLAKGTA
jgi:DNA-binding winged helix-turn-helix (wHTH) protein